MEKLNRNEGRLQTSMHNTYCASPNTVQHVLKISGRPSSLRKGQGNGIPHKSFVAFLLWEPAAGSCARKPYVSTVSRYRTAGPGSALFHYFQWSGGVYFPYFARIQSDELPRTSQLVSSFGHPPTPKPKKLPQKTILTDSLDTPPPPVQDLPGIVFFLLFWF